mgnify:FL=1
MNEGLGKVHFLFTFIFMTGTFLFMHIVGWHGHMRRIPDPTVYEFLRAPGVVWMNQFMTICAFALGLAQVPFVLNFFYSLVAGPKAEANPWKANSLEWTTASPPPHYNFEDLPRVFHAPYEYSVPGGEEDYLPQTSPLPPNITLDPVMA